MKMELVKSEQNETSESTGRRRGGSSRSSGFQQGESFKWMLCKFYKDGNVDSCKHGSNCAFAHGAHEKVEKPARSGSKESRGVKRSASSANLPSAMCVHFLKNSCNKGDQCKYSHDQEEFNKSLPSTYKTSLCANYMGTGRCNRESACGFAHGRYELRPFGYKGNFEEKIKETPNWKTTECQYFTKTGQCRNGDDCPFAHGNNELRMMKQTPFDETANFAHGGGMMGMREAESMCKFYLEGFCKSGSKCRFSHGMSNAVPSNEILDYTRDVTPATMRDVAAPIMSKDLLYNEFMSFLNQKFQGTGNFAAQNALVMEAPMNLASMAQVQQSAILTRNPIARPMARSSLNPMSSYKPSNRSPQFVQQAVRESVIKPPMGSKAAPSSVFKTTGGTSYMASGNHFDDIF